MRKTKRWLLPMVTALFGFAGSVSAQSSAYTFSASSGTFDTLTSGTNVSAVEADFGASGVLPLGFTFNFNGTNYTDVVAASDGFISFNTSSSSITSNGLASPTSSSLPLVAALWDDLAGGATGGSTATYQTTGTAPNRVFTFEWKNWEWRYNSSSPVISFQVKLYETSNVIEFHYKDEGNAPTTPTASIGLADANSFLSVQSIGTPTVSSTHSADTLSVVPATGTIYTFTPPSCLPPVALTVNDLQGTSVKLKWTGTSSQFTYQNVTSGTTPTGVGTLVSADSVVLTGLTANTGYDFYVREICAVGDTSAWVGPITYTTPCASVISAFPWTEGFEGVTTPDFPSCFVVNNNNNDGDTWETVNSTTYANTGSISAVIYTDYNSGANDDYLILPAFQLTGNERFKFFSRARSTFEPNDYQVLVSQSGTGAASFTDTLLVDTATATTYAEHILDLSAYTGVTYIAFHVPQGGLDGYYLYIDDLTVEAIPSCLQVTTASLISSNGTTVEVGWDNPSMASSFEYTLVDTAGITTTGVVSNDTAILNTVTNETYELYIRAICAVGDTSAIAGPFAINAIPTANGVSCGSMYTQLLFSEEFDNNNAGWTGDIGSANYDWEIPDNAGSSNTGADNAFSGANYMNFEASGITLDSGSIVSPLIDLSQASGSAELSFWMHAYGADMGELKIGVGTSASGPFTTEFSWAGDLQQSGNEAWQNIGVDLSAYIGQQIYIELKQIDSTGYSGDMSIDLFEVSACVSCPLPSQLTYSDVTTNSAKLKWVSNAMGGSFAYINVPAGTIPTGLGTVVAADSVILSGLTSNTSYDFYVREVCAVGDSSAWFGPINYTTLCNVFTAPFAENFDGTAWTPGTGATNAGDVISNCWWRNVVPNAFAWGTRTGSTSAFSSGPSQDNTTGSGNYVYVESSNGSNGDVAILETPSIDLTGLANPYLKFAYHMYGSTIDTLFISVKDGMGGVTVVDSIVGQQQTDDTDPWLTKFVDISAYAGQTISIQWETKKDGTNGDVAIDDISVYQQNANDAGVIGFVAPTNFCGNPLTEITAIIQNFGSNAISGFDVVVDWTGSTTGSISRTYTGSLGFNQIDTIIIDTLNTSFGGTFNLIGYTQLSGDNDNNNDSTTVTGVTFLPALNAPTLVTPAAMSICVGDTVLAEAQGISGSTTVIWRDVNGTLISSGDTLEVIEGVTPDTLYASHAYGTAGNQVGPIDNTFGAGANFANVDVQTVDFEVYAPVVIDSVTIYPDASGTLDLEIEDNNGVVIFTSSVTVTLPSAGAGVRIPVGASLQPGVYAFGASATSTIGMYRNSAGASYPYTSASGSLAITGNSFGVAYYYFYYDWSISEFGCESPATMVTYTADSVVVNLGTDISYCESTAFSATLDAGNAGATFLWNDGSVAQTLVVDTAGTYSVEVTNVNGCMSMDTLVVTEDAAPMVVLGDSAICAGGTITLDAGAGFDTYMWSSGATSQTIDVTTAGTYIVTVTNTAGCSTVDSSVVTVNTASVSLQGDTVCVGEMVTLDAGAGFDTYMWSTGATSQTIDVTTAGTYSVTVTTTEGCTADTDASVGFNPIPVVDLGADTGLSVGQELMLDAGNAGSVYAWSNSETSQTIRVTYADVPADFSVMVTDANGCVGMDTIFVDRFTGINELGITNIELYPNPAASDLNMAFNATEAGDFRIEMFNLNGQLVITEVATVTAGSNQLNWSVNELPSGVYFIKASLNDSSIGEFRVVKQ